MTVVLTGNDLTLEELLRVARAGERVALAPEATERMQEARAIVEQALARGVAVYGLTTGLGSRKRIGVEPAAMAAFNRLLILAHRVGQGQEAPEVPGQSRRRESRRQP